MAGAITFVLISVVVIAVFYGRWYQEEDAYRREQQLQDAYQHAAQHGLLSQTTETVTRYVDSDTGEVLKETRS